MQGAYDELKGLGRTNIGNHSLSNLHKDHYYARPDVK